MSNVRPADLGHKVSFGLAACWRLHSAYDPKFPDLFISLLCDYPFPPGTGGGESEQHEFRMSAPSPPCPSGVTQFSPCPVALSSVSTLPGLLPGNKTSHLTVTIMVSHLLRVRLSPFLPVLHTAFRVLFLQCRQSLPHLNPLGSPVVLSTESKLPITVSQAVSALVPTYLPSFTSLQISPFHTPSPSPQLFISPGTLIPNSPTILNIRISLLYCLLFHFGLTRHWEVRVHCPSFFHPHDLSLNNYLLPLGLKLRHHL